MLKFKLGDGFTQDGFGNLIRLIKTTIEAPGTPPNTTSAQTSPNRQVTTTHAIIFRDGPGGEDIGRVMYNATLQGTAEATAQDSRWYQVEWLSQQGWISADYVTAVCE